MELYARLAKQYFGIKDKPKKVKKKKAVEISKDDFVQDVIQVKDIRSGMILTKDGRYIMVMDIQAVNYDQMTPKQKNSIVASFAQIFRICPIRMQFKTMTEYINVEPMVENVKKCNAGVTDKNIRMAADDYIDSLHSANTAMGIIKKYYIIFQYEQASDENSTGKLEDIYAYMRNIYNAIARILTRQMGNTVIEHENENMFLLEFLYRFYNKKSCRKEPYMNRYIRIYQDRKQYYESIGKAMEPIDIVDFFAPRGIDFKSNKDFFCMDGLYYTYLAITDDGYPSQLSANWLSNTFNYGVGVDIDFYIKRLPKEITEYRLEKGAALKRISAEEKAGNRIKYKDLMQQVGNSEAILDQMKKGEDIYDCVTILTLWSSNPKGLIRLRQAIITDMKSKGITMEYSHLDCISYFKMTAPLLDYQSNIYSRDAKNFLSTSLASIYNMTSFQMFDETGYAMGYNLDNDSVVSINNYNTGMFKNGNMLIIGTSGAGKSFTEMFISRKQFLTGIGTYFILPSKGYEYKDACLSLSGQYISLIPGSKDCINIMEIRPEGVYKKTKNEDDDVDIIAEQSQSLLAKKISSLSVWIQLLLTEGDAKISSIELNKFNNVVAKVYENYGINDDNTSILNPDGTLKKMPIISDLYDALDKDKELHRLAAVLLPFVSGSCRNMNRQTNVDLTNRCIVFNVEESIIGEDLLAAFMYIAFDCAYDIVRADKDNFDTIILDEVWRMLKTPACAKQVQRLVKLIRGYAGSVLIATQEINDFINDPGGFGVSVINNTQIKFLMQLTDKEAELVGSIMKLSEADMKTLTMFDRGQGMIIANDKKVLVAIKATDYETALFTTDLNVKREFEAKNMRKAAFGTDSFETRK